MSFERAEKIETVREEKTNIDARPLTISDLKDGTDL